MVDKRIIAALDVHSFSAMKELVSRLGESISFYKVGMELFYSAGPQVVEYLKECNKQVFLDLKVHDIPHTVGQSIRALTRLGADFMTVHSAGGREMMEQAAAAAQEEALRLGITRPKLLAVTVLTSMDAAAWKEIGGSDSVASSVLRLAALAKAAGIDGTVSSPQEAGDIRRQNGTDFLIVTPGIRHASAAVQDQKRIATPQQALQNGASYLVIGRPITQAPDPRQAAEKIIAAIREV